MKDVAQEHCVVVLVGRVMEALVHQARGSKGHGVAIYPAPLPSQPQPQPCPKQTNRCLTQQLYKPHLTDKGAKGAQMLVDPLTELFRACDYQSLDFMCIMHGCACSFPLHGERAGTMN